MSVQRIAILASVIAIACSSSSPSIERTQLETRQFQTRSFSDTNVETALKAVLNVLQDDGFIIRDAEKDLGLIVATKEIDVENKVEATAKSVMRPLVMVGTLGIFGRSDARWNKNATLECSANVSEFGDDVRVRVNFLWKVMNNRGEITDVEQVEDPTFYQEFFARMDKSLFLEKENL